MIILKNIQHKSFFIEKLSYIYIELKLTIMKKILLLLTASVAVSNLYAQVDITASSGTTNGTYTTLKGAFDAINSGTHQGAINISITGNTTETATAILNASAGTASYTSVLIKPATGVTATITSASTVATIKFNGADNVTINGSNDGSSSRNLTISNTYVATAGTTPVVLWVSSTATDGSENITLRNTNFAGSSGTGTVGTVIVSGTTLGAAEVPNNNFSAINNTFIRAQNGIFVVGNATNTDTGAIIRNNEIGSTVTADKMLYRGIAVQNSKNFEVSGNIITGVILPANSTNPTQGILIGAAATNGTIFNNVISDIKNPNPSGYGAVGIYLNSTNAAANMLVYNNFVSNVAGNGYATGGGVNDNGNGIFINQGAGYKIYYNTVHMNTNQGVSGRPAAFNVGSGVTAAGAVDVRNNIFVNTQTQAGEKYAIYSAAANTVFSNIDYNDYYSSGTNLGYIGSARATLADIVTGFGSNASSIKVLPVFVSATDLRLSTSNNAALDNKGTPIAGVTMDIDGNTRSATTPDLGGSEFTDATLAVQDVNKSKINYYPNPVVDQLQISNDKKISNIEVYNASGSAVKNVSINAEKGSVDMRQLPAGVYILKINSDKQSETIKVIKN